MPLDPNFRAPAYSVGYQAKASGYEKCELCAFFRSPSGCSKVIEPVSPQGWCNRFMLVKDRYNG